MEGLYPDLIEAILAEAAGEGTRRESFCGNVVRCRRYILALEAFGLLEARMGEEQGEDPDDAIITGITPLGLSYLRELRSRLGRTALFSGSRVA
jgi:hypothetical protein